MSNGMADVEAPIDTPHPFIKMTCDEIRGQISAPGEMHIVMAAVNDRVAEAAAAPRDLEAQRDALVQALRQRYQRVFWPIRRLLLEAPPVSSAPPPESLHQLRVTFDQTSQDLRRHIEDATRLFIEEQDITQQFVNDAAFDEFSMNMDASEKKSVQTALADGNIPELTVEEEGGQDEITECRAEAILGVRPGASAAEVEKAYKTLSRLYHPDRCGALEPSVRASMCATFRRLTICYETLMAKKKGHDETAASAPMVDTMVDVVVKANRLQQACRQQQIRVQRDMHALKQEQQQGYVTWTLNKARKRLKAALWYVTGSTHNAKDTDDGTEALNTQEVEVLQRTVAWQQQAVEDLKAVAELYKSTSFLARTMHDTSDFFVRFSELNAQLVGQEARKRERKPKSRKADKHQAMTQGSCFDLLRLPHDAPVDLILMAYKAWLSVYEGQGTTKGTDATAMLKRLEEAYKWCVKFAEGKTKASKRHMGGNGKGRGRRQCQQQQQEGQGLEVNAGVDGTTGGQYEFDDLD